MKWFVFLFIAIIFIVSPYKTGLYSNDSFYSLSLIIFSLYLLLFARLLFKKELYLFKNVSFILLLPLCYIISLPVAENPKGAWDSLLQWVTFIAFFLLLYWSASDRKINRWLPLVFQMTGAWIAIYSILLFLGIVELNGAFVADRLGSVFKYPNTFGMSMIVFFLFSLVLLLKKENALIFKIVYSLPLLLFFVSFILSYSRGMILVFPIVWFIGLLLLKARKQIEYCIYSIISISLSFVAYIILVRDVSPSFKSIVLLVLILISTVLILTIKFLVEKWENRLNWIEFKNIYRVILPLVILLLFTLGVLDVINKGLVFQQLPSRFQERVESIDITSGTAKERLIFNKDALKISKESPFIGFGGEAFRVIHKKYQELPYQANKIHNGFFEWLVDTGWVGLLILISVILYLYKRIIQRYIKEENVIQLAVFLSTLVIFIHSFIDFNFSYGSVWLLVFWLFTMGISKEIKIKTPHIKKNKKKQMEVTRKKDYFSIVVYSLFTILVGFCIVFSYRFMVADQIMKEVTPLTKNIKIEQQIERAVRLDPTNIEYWKKLGSIYLEGYKHDHTYKKKVEDVINRITNLEPNNSNVLRDAGTLAEKIGNTKDAIKFYEKGIKVDRFNTSLYTQSIMTKTTFANKLKMEGNTAEINPLLQEAIKEYKQNVYWYEEFLEKPLTDHDAFNGRNFSISDSTHYYAALSYYLLGEYEQVLSILDYVGEQKKEDLVALGILSLEHLGEKEKATELLGENEKRFKNLRDSIERVRKTY